MRASENGVRETGKTISAADDAFSRETIRMLPAVLEPPAAGASQSYSIVPSAPEYLIEKPLPRDPAIGLVCPKMEPTKTVNKKAKER